MVLSVLFNITNRSITIDICNISGKITCLYVPNIYFHFFSLLHLRQETDFGCLAERKNNNLTSQPYKKNIKIILQHIVSRIVSYHILHTFYYIILRYIIYHYITLRYGILYHTIWYYIIKVCTIEYMTPSSGITVCQYI